MTAEPALWMTATAGQRPAAAAGEWQWGVRCHFERAGVWRGQVPDNGRLDHLPPPVSDVAGQRAPGVGPRRWRLRATGALPQRRPPASEVAGQRAPGVGPRRWRLRATGALPQRRPPVRQQDGPAKGCAPGPRRVIVSRVDGAREGLGPPTAGPSWQAAGHGSHAERGGGGSPQTRNRTQGALTAAIPDGHGPPARGLSSVATRAGQGSLAVPQASRGVQGCPSPRLVQLRAHRVSRRSATRQHRSPAPHR